MAEFDAAQEQEQTKGKGLDVDICTLVKADLDRRTEVGEKTYGSRLKPFNGRDALLDAYQEALDLAQYLRQAIFERDGK